MKQFRTIDGTMIYHCYHNCRYFVTAGSSEPMECHHPKTLKKYPKWPDFCIISHPDCDTGFPKECPLPIVEK